MIIPPLRCRFAVGSAGLTAPMNVVPRPDPFVNNAQESRARLNDCSAFRPGQTAARQRGILSCFFQGFSTVLLRSMLSARQMRRRVERGRITSSMYPRYAAVKGLAKRAWYSLLRRAVLSASV